jgi:galactonate dehydratase
MSTILSLEYFRVPPRWLFVKISDSQNLVGWGEASLEGHSESVEGCLEAYREHIVGMDPECVIQPPAICSCWLAKSYVRCSDIEHIWQKLYRLGFYRGGPVLMSALAGVDIALWDLKGKHMAQGRERSLLTDSTKHASYGCQYTNYWVANYDPSTRYTHG